MHIIRKSTFQSVMLTACPRRRYVLTPLEVDRCSLHQRIRKVQRKQKQPQYLTRLVPKSEAVPRLKVPWLQQRHLLFVGCVNNTRERVEQLYLLIPIFVSAIAPIPIRPQIMPIFSTAEIREPSAGDAPHFC